MDYFQEPVSARYPLAASPFLPTTKRSVGLVRLLILAGLLFMMGFLVVYFQPENRGHPWLFGLLTASVLFKLLRLLHEWYHYWRVVAPPLPTVTRTWSVDVLTTFCPGEPYDMVINTLQAIQAIRYPHTTYLCDEANDPYLKEVCRRLGVRHVTRTIKKDAKAGNINHALQQATGEICLVLDPDHVPVPDFLDNVLPYFENPHIGFVQCVQAYANHRESLVAYGAAEQTYSFYGPMMTCMSNYGTAQAIGANCTFRRAALDSIGGHAAGLSEDMHTAMQLHAKNWQSVYVPLPLSYGLVPATMSAYYKQQLKWARGTFELLFATYPALFRGFTWRQRLHYLAMPLYYLLGIVQLIDFIVPVLSLVWLELPLRLDLLLFATVYLPLLMTGFLIRQFAQRWLIEEHEVGFHVIGGVLSSGTWWVYVLGFVYTLFRVNVPYLPTPKNDQPRNNLLLCLPNILVGLATLLAMGYSLYHFGRFTFYDHYMQMMLGFALVNLLIVGSNVLLGQERLLLGTKTRLQRIVLNRPAGQSLRFGIWRARYGLYSWLRTSAVGLFGALLIITTVLINYTHEQQTAGLLPRGIQYATTQPFYYGSESGQFVRNIKNQRVGLIITPQHLTWPTTAGSPIAPAEWPAQSEVLPLLYIEPDFSGPAPDEVVTAFLGRIRQGQCDSALVRFADSLKRYQRPLLVCFAPYFDDSTQPWGSSRESTLAAYRQTWQYLVRYCRQQQVRNVTWVWCPTKPNTITYFHPEADYMNWIGLAVMNDPTRSQDRQSHSFGALYQPLRNAIRMHPVYDVQQKPVLITNLGTTVQTERQKWTANAMSSIHERYTEVKGVVFAGK